MSAPVGTFDEMLDLGAYLDEQGFDGAVGLENGVYLVVVYRNHPTPDLTEWKGVPITYRHSDEGPPSWP